MKVPQSRGINRVALDEGLLFGFRAQGPKGFRIKDGHRVLLIFIYFQVTAMLLQVYVCLKRHESCILRGYQMLESPGSGTKVYPDILDEGRTRLQRKLIIAKKDHVDNNVRHLSLTSEYSTSAKFRDYIHSSSNTLKLTIVKLVNLHEPLERSPRNSLRNTVLTSFE
jgi:hypothetical protein